MPLQTRVKLCKIAAGKRRTVLTRRRRAARMRFYMGLDSELKVHSYEKRCFFFRFICVPFSGTSSILLLKITDKRYLLSKRRAKPSVADARIQRRRESPKSLLSKSLSRIPQDVEAPFELVSFCSLNRAISSAADDSPFEDWNFFRSIFGFSLREGNYIYFALLRISQYVVVIKLKKCHWRKSLVYYKMIPFNAQERSIFSRGINSHL